MSTVAGEEQEIEAPISSSLRALVAVASRLGLDLSVEQLQRRFAVPSGEPDTPTLVALARELGLETQVLSISFQELPRVARALPAILRAKDGGALILEEARSDPAKGTIAVIRDPSATVDVVLAIDELHLAEVWAGEVILVKRHYSVSDENRPFGMGWLFGQVLKERKLFRDIVASAAISTVFAIAPPLTFRIVLDRVLGNNSYSTLNVLVGGVLILIVFETILTYLRNILTQVVTSKIDGRMHLYIMEKLVKLPMDYFERTPTGKIITALHQVWLIRPFLTGQLFGAFLDAVPLIGLVPVMLLIEWHLALMAFALGGIIFAIVIVFLKPLRKYHIKVMISEQAKGSHLTETIHGMRTVKSLVLEGRRRREWDRLVSDAVADGHALGLMANYPQTLTLPFQRLIYSGCIAVGAYMVLANVGSATPSSITAGSLVAFAMLS